MAEIQVRPLITGHVEDVQRLHKYATYNSRPVFGQYSNDAAKILQAAAANEQGAFGLVAVLTDPEEPEEPEVVGALTAQIIPISSNSSSDCSNHGIQPSAAVTTSETAGKAADQQTTQRPAAESSECELVLLTLVVRADARKQGVGRQLLQALLTQAVEQNARQPCKQIVTDIALNNQPAWRFFEQSGFQRSSATSDGTTAEAVLLLGPPPAAALAPEAAAAPSSTGPAACQVAAAQHHNSALTSCSSSSRLGSYLWSGNGHRPVRMSTVACNNSSRCRSTSASVGLGSCAVYSSASIQIRRQCPAGARLQQQTCMHGAATAACRPQHPTMRQYARPPAHMVQKSAAEHYCINSSRQLKVVATHRPLV